MSQSTAQWKSEQREILRAAFAPGFVKYAELVNKVNEPDDWRKYLDFIARQVGLEEPASKAGPHDGFAMVNINIGGFTRTAIPLQGLAPALVEEVPPTVDEPTESEPVPPSFEGIDASLLALDVLAPDPVPADDFESTLDNLLA